MHALKDRGYCESIYGDLYKKLFHRGDRSGNRGIAYIPLEYINVKAANTAVKEAGGVPVLAHPGQSGNLEAVEEWVEAGLQGIEVYHPLHRGDDYRMAREYVQKHQLVATGEFDLFISSSVYEWDVAAARIFLEQNGGTFLCGRREDENVNPGKLLVAGFRSRFLWEETQEYLPSCVRKELICL